MTSRPEQQCTIFDSGNTLTNFTLLSTVGEATEAILENPAETLDRYVFIKPFRATQNDVLDALAKATGQKWKVRKTTCEEESRIGREMMEHGEWAGIGQAVMGASYSGGKYDFAQGRQLDKILLGLPMNEDLEATVAKIVKGEKV